MKIACGLALISLLSWGQDTPPKEVRKMIRLKYVEPSRVQRLLSSYSAPTHVGQWTLVTNIQADDSLHTLIVSGPAETVAAYEEAVRKVDVAPATFELTVYLISNSPSDQLPDALGPAAKQLHGLFAFKGYQLLDSFELMGRDGQRGIAQGSFLKDGKTSSYSFQYALASVTGETPKNVNLHNLSLMVTLHTGVADKDGNPIGPFANLLTDIDIRDGQKVVVGKSDVNGGASPLILVVTAKVVE
jgi:hypothetical protein